MILGGLFEEKEGVFLCVFGCCREEEADEATGALGGLELPKRLFGLWLLLEPGYRLEEGGGREVARGHSSLQCKAGRLALSHVKQGL